MIKKFDAFAIDIVKRATLNVLSFIFFALLIPQILNLIESLAGDFIPDGYGTNSILMLLIGVIIYPSLAIGHAVLQWLLYKKFHNQSWYSKYKFDLISTLAFGLCLHLYSDYPCLFDSCLFKAP